MTSPSSLHPGGLADLGAPVDVVVIGAGPAGTAAAALLHRDGFTVRVLEQTTFPRFVIGESLLPHCMDILDAAGLLDAARSRGYLVKNGALFFRGGERCSFSFAEQYTPGWTWTWQVPRADFDLTLANAVTGMGVPIHWRTSVTGASFDQRPRLDVVDEHGKAHTLTPRFVVDASGYGRVLPRLLGLDRPSRLPERMALFTHVQGDRRPPGPDEGRIWICIHPQGAWLWIIPFSNGLTSVGAVSTPDFFERFPGTPEQSLRAILACEPAARERLADTTFEFEPRTLRGYSASVSRLFGPGYCLVGNATEFLDPVFSSGVTLALESSHRASGLVARTLRGESPDWQREYTDHMMRGIDVFRTFVTRWYDGALPDIFFSSRHDEKTRAKICSVLAGYVWDQTNPLVQHHARKVEQLLRLTRQQSAPAL
jgi:2-polyprenyl-6-methoxyphenol hydroxylase-like FAD-dependent oxidoreductase